MIAEPEIAGAADDEAKRMLRFFALSHEWYMASSTNACRIVTPTGTTHQFVIEVPDFVIAATHDAVIDKWNKIHLGPPVRPGA